MKRVYLIALSIMITLPAFAQFNNNTQTMPTASFQSTSTMAGSGSMYASQPMLNADGSAYNPYSSAASSGSRRMRMLEDEDTPPDVIETPTGKQPLGDAVLPLMLMAMVFGLFIAWRRRMVKR